MVTLTIATQVDWANYADAHVSQISTARTEYMHTSIVAETTDGVATLTYDNVEPYVGWTGWVDEASANDYITFITDAANAAGVTITTSLVDLSTIPTENVNHFKFN